MDNRNIFNQQQLPQQNGFYPYGYPAATVPMMRPELPAYMMPQTAASAVLKGRPVSSFEEARVAQIDLDGSVSIFPDLGNKRIYTKRINVDGTAAINTYSLDEKAPIEAIATEYATKAEIADLKNTLDALIEKLQSTEQSKTKLTQPLNF